MKLTRLRLHGFKSFVEPTDFMIEPGLTGVVGPNGCGKSNLVEALRWAMGETSHKSLRAADMDAVIFAGSGNRPARNHAEVVMTIDNADRTAPAAVNDSQMLEISRRIEREAGSVYRINGRDVRARDVQILFADAATGARSPALVHQGKIGEIIQAKPEQRRRVLEDAAGVAGLHARRHEAELRLKAAETNLTRVEDVIGQLVRPDRRVEEAGAPGHPLPRSRRQGAQGRGHAVPSALAGGQCRRRGSRAYPRHQRSRDGRAHPRAGRGRAHPGDPRLRTAGAARGRSPRRGRTAAPHQCARTARPRGRARQGARRRARPAADAIRRRHRARAAADLRRRSGAAAARHRRRRVKGRDQVARRKALRRR